MTPIDELLLQMAIEIREGEGYTAHLRVIAGGKRTGPEREAVRDVEAEVDFLKRQYHAYHLKAESVVKGIALPLVDEGPTKTSAERIRAAVARQAREGALV